MTLQEFNEMPFAEKGIYLIENGKKMGIIEDGDEIHVLFELNDFFVEVRYSKGEDKILEIEGFYEEILKEYFYLSEDEINKRKRYN